VTSCINLTSLRRSNYLRHDCKVPIDVEPWSCWLAGRRHGAMCEVDAP
jgi:hypothetical protein